MFQTKELFEGVTLLCQKYGATIKLFVKGMDQTMFQTIVKSFEPVGIEVRWMLAEPLQGEDPFEPIEVLSFIARVPLHEYRVAIDLQV